MKLEIQEVQSELPRPSPRTTRMFKRLAHVEMNEMGPNEYEAVLTSQKSGCSF